MTCPAGRPRATSSTCAGVSVFGSTTPSIARCSRMNARSGSIHGVPMLRSTMSAVPRRLPVLWGKTGVYALVALALAIPAAFIAFFSGQAILSGKHILRRDDFHYD